MTALTLIQALAAYRLVYVHVGALHGPARELYDATSGLGFAEISGTALVEAPTVADPHLTHLHVTGLEALRCRGESLSILRSRVVTLLEKSTTVCLSGRLARTCFMSSPGSSIFIDSSPYYLAPDWNKSGLTQLLRSAFSEVSVGTLMELERAIFDFDATTDDLTSHLTGTAVDEMRSAGVLVRSQSGALTLARPRVVSELRDAVSDAVADLVEAPERMGELAEQMFALERSIRAAIRASSLEARERRWRRGLLPPDLESKAVERAQADGLVGVRKVHELRDPLEWLSFGELLTVASQLGLGDRPPSFWDKVRADIAPVRNRLSHMRVPHEADLGLVKKTRVQLQRALGTHRDRT